MFLQFVSGNPESARELFVGFAPGFGISGIEKSEFLAAVHPFDNLIGGDSGRRHCLSDLRSHKSQLLSKRTIKAMTMPMVFQRRFLQMTAASSFATFG